MQKAKVNDGFILLPVPAEVAEELDLEDVFLSLTDGEQPEAEESEESEETEEMEKEEHDA